MLQPTLPLTAQHTAQRVICTRALCPLPFRPMAFLALSAGSPLSTYTPRRAPPGLRDRSRQLGTGSSSVLVIPSHTRTTLIPPSPYQHPQPPHQHRTTAPSTTPKGLPVLYTLLHTHTSRRQRVEATCMPRRSRRPHAPSTNIGFTPWGSPSMLVGLQSHPLQIASRGIPMPGRRGRGFCQQRKTSGAPTH